MRRSTALDIFGLTAGTLALVFAVGQANASSKSHKGTKPAASVAAPRYAVDMWWNIGGDMGGLKKATDACVKKLGEAERPTLVSPPPSTTILTKPMLDCLEAQGWRPAGEPRPV
ncbi:hypothetical protein A1351_07080 [Methylosinus sp. R-45379]|jgi:hypothetical protein|uniref:hypothetical protein n=1 Tax=unclassified Methylosinus TaxID=2624500 RepID=UPI00046322B1|nr:MULTISPECIES: hypothetical protein [unclassified Methylosinus]OAI31038.1 hypothetical protein A1351_07080 [Methylosinus sp. R-45379]TDX63457.1 hypothetical protein EDE12_10796 [Methylosinus sp. sav-2]